MEEDIISSGEEVIVVDSDNKPTSVPSNSQTSDQGYNMNLQGFLEEINDSIDELMKNDGDNVIDIEKTSEDDIVDFTTASRGSSNDKVERGETDNFDLKGCRHGDDRFNGCSGLDDVHIGRQVFDSVDGMCNSDLYELHNNERVVAKKVLREIERIIEDEGAQEGEEMSNDEKIMEKVDRFITGKVVKHDTGDCWGIVTDEVKNKENDMGKIDVQVTDALEDLDKDGGRVADMEVAMKGDGVVETDTGYYWLTCSIEDGDQITQSVYKRSSGDCTTEGVNSAICGEKVTTNFDEPDGCSDTNFIRGEINSGSRQVETNMTQKEKMSFLESQRNHGTSQETVSNDGQKNSAMFLPNDGEDIDLNEVDSARPNFKFTRDSENMDPNVMLDSETSNSKLYRSRSLRNSCELRNHLDDQCLRVSNKDNRKYSCPENLFRVFKVLSVDIPKVNESDEKERPKSNSCDKFEKQSVNDKKMHRSSLEQKKNRILEYLTEISSMRGVEEKGGSVLGSVTEPVKVLNSEKHSASLSKSESYEKCKENEKPHKKSGKDSKARSKGVHKIGRSLTTERNDKKRRPTQDLHIQPPAISCDSKQKGVSTNLILVCIFSLFVYIFECKQFNNLFTF